jgi:ribosomal peptide maturation radical SAM protein 1
MAETVSEGSYAPFRVALVCMPFYAALRPSIQIGLLQAIAQDAGFQTDSFHLNINLAAVLGLKSYNLLSQYHYQMLGEWLFSVSAFGEEIDNNDSNYYAASPQLVSWITKQGKSTEYLSSLRHEVLPRFIDQCLTSVDWGNYKVVGFTSTFQQNVASLALARRIKERYPAVSIIFGGANMADEMGPEYLRAFSYIDYVVVGDGDSVFPELLRALRAGHSVHGMVGLVQRKQQRMEASLGSSLFFDLDSLPTPNYEDYFDRLKRLNINSSEYIWIPFESSRGCWWGTKHQCTFCGLNGANNTYRSKSPRRVITELSELARRHNRTLFEATDNILDMSYIKDFFPRIQQSKTDYHFCYEVKANLSRQQLAILARGGVKFIQPGIGSLSTTVLRLMNKGCTMLQNVRLLKWCRYYRINVSWNLLYGFPGETKEDYNRQLDVLKMIPHLEPPLHAGRFWLERFSPYFCGHQHSHFQEVRPQSSYRYIYPAYVEVGKVAYFFEYKTDGLSDDVYHRTLEFVDNWQCRWVEQKDSLCYRRTMDSLFIEDSRAGYERGIQPYYGPMACIYEFCSETMHTVSQVVEYLKTSPEKYDYSDADVQWALEEFCKRGFMLQEDEKYLSLALPINPNW